MKTFLIAVLCPAAILSAQTVERPPIVGVAHIGLHTNDMDAEREFYGHELGFGDFSLDKPTGGLLLTYYKVNDHQYIEIFPDLKDPAADKLSHVAFETTDANKLRDYLAFKGVKVAAALKPGLDGNLSFTIKDPDGHTLEFVQYVPGSLHSRNFGKLMPEQSVSRHIIHVGFTVADRDASDRLFRDILGFQLMWFGGMKEGETKWIDMRVPDGTDWLEYMVNVSSPTPKTLGVMNHVALGVDSIQSAYHKVLEHGAKPPQPPKIGRDGKWQLNLYDHNDTRAELMEFKPVETPCCSPMLGR